MYLFVLLTNLIFVSAQNASFVRALYSSLFNGYRKEVMPMADHSKPLDIGITFYIASFNSFHEVDETISITAAVFLNWTDSALGWDPVSYGYLYSTIIDSKDLWLPQLFLMNMVDSLQQMGLRSCAGSDGSLCGGECDSYR